MELVNWMYLHLRVDAHFGTRTQYHSFQAVEFRTRVSSYLGLVSWMCLHLRELMFTVGLEPSTIRFKRRRVIQSATVS
ncbi:unnamed protein product [Schistosoma mattheei]|uniref:Uncharacterized protein n=1 Tax=Schistosoma mattheei TaxID=31246 RepID=A0A3P8G2K3_9TREM|nr:unnamed protein product [Schistosoma mattheei]